MHQSSEPALGATKFARSFCFLKTQIGDISHNSGFINYISSHRPIRNKKNSLRNGSREKKRCRLPHVASRCYDAAFCARCHNHKRRQGAEADAKQCSPSAHSASLQLIVSIPPYSGSPPSARTARSAAHAVTGLAHVKACWHADEVKNCPS